MLSSLTIYTVSLENHGEGTHDACNHMHMNMAFGRSARTLEAGGTAVGPRPRSAGVHNLYFQPAALPGPPGLPAAPLSFSVYTVVEVPFPIKTPSAIYRVAKFQTSLGPNFDEVGTEFRSAEINSVMTHVSVLRVLK